MPFLRFSFFEVLGPEVCPVPRLIKQRPRRLQHRGLANLRTKHPDDFEWPNSTSTSSIPTPYEILKQKKSATYCKAQFLELVKIYHPDKQHTQDLNGLSPGTKLERYRLIIAANDILSDPAKRRAYDQCGAGWARKAGSRSWNAQGTGWSGFDSNSARGNATWEDWEKWHRRRKVEKQAPHFMSNGGFVVLIVVFAVLGGMGEITRVGNLSRSFLEQIEAVHDDSSKDLMRRRRESLGLESMDQRVRNFLALRDPSGLGLDPRDEPSSPDAPE